MPDLITEFLSYTEGAPSPEIFRLWSAIACIGAALERRVWTLSAGLPIYPNLYTLLVAPPGVGKYIIHEVQSIWIETRNLKVAPHSTTKASLIDSLKESLRVINGGGELIEYHSLQVAAEEFGVLVPAYDLEYLSNLNHIFNNPSFHSEKRRSINKGEDLIVTNPQLNILAGTQPGYLGTLFPEEAWTMGLASRLLMIYAGDPIQVELFPENDILADRIRGRAGFVKLISGLNDLRGCFDWTDDAIQVIRSWYLAGMPPRPDHSKLTFYSSRRILHLFKLAMIAAVSRSQDLVITLADLSRARDWLLEAEVQMPNIFRAMSHRSDYEIMQELHVYLWSRWSNPKNKQLPLREDLLYTYLSTKCTSERAPRIVDVMERGGLISRVAGTKSPEALYIPNPRKEHGVE